MKSLLEVSSSKNQRPAWHGKATLTYYSQGDRTVPQVQTQAPSKVQRPFYPEGEGICHSVLLHTAGGMVGGDRLTYDIHLAADTHALITTAAAAKIYTDHPQPAQVINKLRVESGACLEWLPQEAIVFEGARYHSSLRVDLAAGAHWLGWDILRLGRTARGERFTQGEVRSRCEIWHDGQLIWVDPQRLAGSETLWQSPHGLDRCPVIATLAWVGALPDKAVVAAAREAWESIPNHRGEMGVTRLQLGLLCRYRGHSTGMARRWLTAVWQLLRPHYGKPAATIPRVWQRT
ncbi:MAG: urease accessory protein UreD [Cyanobacteria bacterium P01_H01_bin.58]